MFDSVRELLAESGFPGMKVLQFAFTGEDSVDLPHNYPRNCVAYPGTHDNNTLTGWFREELTPAQRKQAEEYFALTKQEGNVRGMLRGVGQHGGARHHSAGRLAGGACRQPG